MPKWIEGKCFSDQAKVQRLHPEDSGFYTPNGVRRTRRRQALTFQFLKPLGWAFIWSCCLMSQCPLHCKVPFLSALVDPFGHNATTKRGNKLRKYQLYSKRDFKFLNFILPLPVNISFPENKREHRPSSTTNSAPSTYFPSFSAIFLH